MARQIQHVVRQVTAQPILYLVNTNYHGDHTFGNYAFPAETTIIAHRKTAERMRHFEPEQHRHRVPERAPSCHQHLGVSREQYSLF